MHCSIFELFYKETDSPEMKQRKKMFIACCSIGGIVCFGAAGSGETMFFTISTLIAGCFDVFLLIKWYITKTQETFEIILIVYSSLLLIMISDVARLSEMREPLWPSAILMMDVILMGKLPGYVEVVALVSFCLYFIIIGIERVIRFGLFDIINPLRMRELRGCFDLTPEELAATPCKQPIYSAAMLQLSSLSVFVLSYFATRSFAVGMQREKAKLQASVSLAETVVAALVRFDLEEAATCIGNEEHTALSEVLNKLLQNLHQYRPYLPDSLFEFSEESFHVSVSPPQDQAAILFTDLKSSTAIWEASPDAMKRALKMHNNIIRSCLGDYGGYEVKTIGDAFMVAFEDMTSGCSFAMAVQEKIMSTTWPTELILPDNFISNGWNGLVLRIGIHFGEVTTEVSKLSGRTDYFGRTVNRAARLEGACTPGGIAIDVSLLNDIPDLEGWHYKITSETLKGIDDHPTAIAIIETNSSREELCSEKPMRTMSSVPTISDTGSESIVATLPMEKRTFATVCNVRIEMTEKIYSQHLVSMHLSKTISCLERTEGSIIAVVSSFITIGWNTVRATPTHVENSVRFTSLMYSTFSSPGEIFIGLSSSPVHCGTVGTREQRFVTVFGDCVATCGLLCQACYDIGAFALCTISSINEFRTRPVDRWLQNNSSIVSSDFLIYEIQVGELRSWLPTMFREEQDDWGWSEEYWSAFDRKDWSEIDASAPQDKVLREVSNMLRKGKSLRYSG